MQKIHLLIRLILFTSCLVVPHTGFPQENVDDMFTDPEAGIIDESKEEMDIKEITTEEKPRFSGSVTIEGGFVLGLSEWRQSFTDAIDFSPFYSLESRLTVDVRPASYIRFYANVGTSSPAENPEDPDRTEIDFTPLYVEELFLDYTPWDWLFLRLGKQDMTWGQGRLFNPADFVSEAADGISVKGFVPIGTNGLTAVVIGEGVLGPTSPDYDNVYDLIAAAALFESSFWNVTMGLSAYYRNQPGLRTGAYLKMPVSRFDLALEGVINWGSLETGTESGQVLTSLFWEGENRRLQLLFEYLFDTAVADYRGHTLGLGILVRDWLPGGWKPGVRWVHGFADHSGQVVLGFEGPVARNLRLAVGFPFRYGVADGYFESVVDSQLPEDDLLDEWIPDDPAAAMVMLLSLSLKF